MRGGDSAKETEFHRGHECGGIATLDDGRAGQDGPNTDGVAGSVSSSAKETALDGAR